jgi:hypothetical protein
MKKIGCSKVSIFNLKLFQCVKKQLNEFQFSIFAHCSCLKTEENVISFLQIDAPIYNPLCRLQLLPSICRIPYALSLSLWIFTATQLIGFPTCCILPPLLLRRPVDFLNWKGTYYHWVERHIIYPLISLRVSNFFWTWNIVLSLFSFIII